MPRFTVVPTDGSCRSAEIVARDAAAVLNIVSRLEIGEADVLEDGRYAFSLRLGAIGMWSILQREKAARPEEISAFE